MTKALAALISVILWAATASAQPPAMAPPSPVTRIQTNEGSILSGTIGGGAVTVRTTFGSDVRLDGRRIVSFSGTTLTLDDGSTLQGTLTGGALQFMSTFGTVVESTTQLGPVVVATGSFEKTVAVDKDTTVRMTEGDFR